MEALAAAVEAAGVLRRQVLADDHDDGNVAPLRATTHFFQELEAIHFRHDEIEDDCVRAGLVEASQRDPAVRRFGNTPSAMLQLEAHLMSNDVIVIDHKNAPADRTTYSSQNLGKLLAVYRLDQIFGSAQRKSAILLADHRH